MVNAYIQGTNRRSLALIACETLFIMAAATMSAYLVLGEWPEPNVGAIGAKTVLVAFVWQVCLYYADLYEFGLTGDRRELFARILKALGFGAMILGGLYFWF